ncbi:MAG: DotU family type IV/VI secretion system protein [Gammaproteobacteria bacterium]|nr:DotU family type IV/VI secretion system protein [Gammaproteobacteria bacterium]
MIAEKISAQLIQEFSPFQQFPIGQGYFRSKLLVTDAFTNPLVAAASPLISILERIHIATHLPEIENLHQDITHEFKAFYSRLSTHDYSDEFYSFAHYLLSATTDELLGKSYLRLKGEPIQFNAFTPISNQNINPQDYFFDILNHLMNAPEQFLDLIELAYFCLLIGFEGKYHLQNDGRLILDNLTESLFQTIQKLRTNKTHKLFKHYILKTHTQRKKNSVKKITLLTSCLIIFLGLVSQVYIDYQTKNVLEHSLIYME